MKELKEELKKLEQELGSPAYDAHIEQMKGKYTSPEEKRMISEFIMSMFDRIGTEINDMNNQIDTLKALKEVSNIISLSYIAKTYFKKSKSWFSQRLNGNKVHGKECKFTEEEIQTLRFAIKDISKKLGSLSI